MNAVAIIFARGGSKGLPGKNIKIFHGKPLIAWAIEHAKSVERIKRVIVSTDSVEIANIAKFYGAEVPFMRPENLAMDNSPEWQSWRHALEFIYQEKQALPDVMVSIPATAPLRLSIDIEKCLDEFLKGGADAVITVADAYRNPHFNMVRASSSEFYELVIPASTAPYRRQDAPIIYDITTVAYAVDPKFIFKCNSIFEGKVRAVKIPIERSIDIDSQLDFEIAEFLFSRRLGSV